MPFYDMREFIGKCEEAGELQRIKEEVDWDLEAGAITRRNTETSGPAVLFEKIKDYPPGYRIFGAPLATYKRLAIAMDLPTDASVRDIVNAWNERRKNPIKPVLVKSGPCKENILLGDEVDLYKFPAPMMHGGDGGRYFSTCHIVATKDPDSDWVNWGLYRQMVVSKDSLTGLIVPVQHIGLLFRQKYLPRRIPMEFAVAICPEPICIVVGAAPVPAGVNEVDIIGGVRREPLPVVKCETVDLVVPATAEIVLEGEVSVTERAKEGPFGEYAGYRAMPSVPRPVYKVKAITYRNDPILSMICTGVPIDDGDILTSVVWSAELHARLKEFGLPVTWVYIVPESSSTVVVVSTKTPYPNVASQIAGCVWAHSAGSQTPKIIVVDDDIDPTNLREVFHAWATKCHPVRGTTVLHQAVIAPAVPYQSPEEKHYNIGANVYYDCTWPPRWPKEEIAQRTSFQDTYPEEIKQRVLQNWHTKYGFKGGK